MRWWGDLDKIIELEKNCPTLIAFYSVGNNFAMEDTCNWLGNIRNKKLKVWIDSSHFVEVFYDDEKEEITVSVDEYNFVIALDVASSLIYGFAGPMLLEKDEVKKLQKDLNFNKDVYDTELYDLIIDAFIKKKFKSYKFVIHASEPDSNYYYARNLLIYVESPLYEDYYLYSKEYNRLKHLSRTGLELD